MHFETLLELGARERSPPLCAAKAHVTACAPRLYHAAETAGLHRDGWALSAHNEFPVANAD